MKCYTRCSPMTMVAKMASKASTAYKSEPATGYTIKEQEPLLLDDKQLRARLCKGQLCELCRMGCRYGDELKRRGMKSR